MSEPNLPSEAHWVRFRQCDGDLVVQWFLDPDLAGVAEHRAESFFDDAASGAIPIAKQSENAALRAQVERLEAERLRLREVVKSVEHSERVNPLNGERYKACPSCWQAEPQHFTDCQLAAVLRETEVDTETGRE